jgi:DNA topoisomerase-6 subunit B
LTAPFEAGTIRASEGGGVDAEKGCTSHRARREAFFCTAQRAQARSKTPGQEGDTIEGQAREARPHEAHRPQGRRRPIGRWAQGRCGSTGAEQAHRRRDGDQAARHLGLRVLRQEPASARLRQSVEGAADDDQGRRGQFARCRPLRSQVPKIFGRLLYGSKFHRLRQSRGQQGIGISAAGMYGLLTTGRPVKIRTRTGKSREAHHFELVIDTQKNEPRVKSDRVVSWKKDHGTRVEIELDGAYRGGQHSVDNYIRQISLANPHATLHYRPPNPLKKKDAKEAEEAPPVEVHSFKRVTKELPPDTAEIKPHPYGVELGVLMQMFRDTKARNVKTCLQGDFARVSAKVAGDICERAGVAPTRRPSEVTRDEAEQIHKAIKKTKLMNPPTDCIAPIGEDLLLRALKAEVEADFFATVTRRPTVYRGNPFLVEVGLAYGGNMSADDTITLYRYANRVPLQYQQGACAITKAVTSTDWKSYQLQQPRGALPVGPMLLLVHIASVWVPFTSESKEAIANYPEIIKEIRLGLQECGRRMATHVRKRRREADELKKRAYIEKYIPQVAIGLQEILGFDDRERGRVVDRLSDVLERSRKM